MDAFDQWWEWAEKPVDSTLTIPAEIHDAVMTLTPEERRNRELVNQVVREGPGPRRPAARRRGLLARHLAWSGGLKGIRPTC